MITALKGEIDIQKLPVDSEEHKFNSWKVKYKKSHILHSKCVNGPCQDDENKCLLCIYNSELELPHLPDMVFPNNVMVLQHENGCGIEFNALDALRRVSNGKLSVKVACSEEWKESRQEHGNLDEVKPFDWTFTTDYMGTLLGNFIVKQTDERINVEKLRQREQILFYNDLTLFEDELHDNGIAVCSVKVRVMPSSFFVLLRYFLRVDNVMLRTNDTRLYHEFGTNFILREYTSRAAQASEIKHVPPSVLREPNEVTPLLPLIESQYAKLSFPESSPPGIK